MLMLRWCNINEIVVLEVGKLKYVTLLGPSNIPNKMEDLERGQTKWEIQGLRKILLELLKVAY